MCRDAIGVLGALLGVVLFATPLGAAVPHASAPRLLAKAGGEPFLVDSRYLLFARRGDRDGDAHVLDTATGRLRGVVVPSGCQALGLDRGVAVLTCATTDITQRIKLLDVRSGRLSAVAPVAANNDQRNEVLATRFTDAGRHWIQGEYKSSGDSHTVVTFVFVNRLTGETTKLEDNDAPRGWDLNSVGLKPRPAEACYPGQKTVTRSYSPGGRPNGVTDWLDHHTQFTCPA